RVARQRLQLRLRRQLLLVRRARIIDDALELRTLSGVALHRLPAPLVANQYRFLRHDKKLLRPQRKIERLEERAAGLVVPGGGRDCDIHAPDGVDLVVVDLREDDLLADTDVVVPAAVE